MATTTNKAWQKDSDTTAIDQDAFINAFLDDLDSSLFGIGANSAKPGSPDEGDTFYDTDASRFIKYNGSTWVQLMPDAANAIDSDHYVDGSIDTVHLSADAVTGAKIADDAIDSEHYTDGSIDAAHIASSAVTTVKINADAVTGAKIADDALDSEHYTDGSIDAAHIASSAVTTAKINGDAVTGAKIADDAVDSEHYTDGSIDTAHIADNQVTLAKLSDGTQGGILYYGSGGAPTELAAGTDGYFLKAQGGSANPVWAASGGGKVTAVATLGAKTGAQTSTSTSYVDVSGTTATLTTTKGGLLVWASCTADCNAAGEELYIGLQLDAASEVGVVSATLGAGSTDQNDVLSTVYAWTGVSNASHTVDLRAKKAGHTGGTWRIDTGTLLMMEFDD